jgi:adenylate cyclase class IV
MASCGEKPMKERDTALSLRELAKLSVAERNQILAAYVPMMAEDFATMPELTEFSVLDDEELDRAIDRISFQSNDHD